MGTIMYKVEETFQHSLSPFSVVLYEGADLQEAFLARPQYSFTLVTICGYEEGSLVSHWRRIRKSANGFSFGPDDMESWWENDSDFVLRLEEKRSDVNN